MAGAVYESMVENLKKAKQSLETAKELTEFAKEADIPLTVSEVQIADLEQKIKKMEDALIARGYVIPVV
jgi:hypothetical protein